MHKIYRRKHSKLWILAMFAQWMIVDTTWDFFFRGNPTWMIYECSCQWVEWLNNKKEGNFRKITAQNGARRSKITRLKVSLEGKWVFDSSPWSKSVLNVKQLLGFQVSRDNPNVASFRKTNHPRRLQYEISLVVDNNTTQQSWSVVCTINEICNIILWQN